jgi:hypothetical protein
MKLMLLLLLLEISFHSRQLGGTFVIHKNRGFIFNHLELYAGNHVSLDQLLGFLTRICEESPMECWANFLSTTPRDWNQLKPKNGLSSELLVINENNYEYELGQNNIPYENSASNSIQDTVLFYNQFVSEGTIIINQTTNIKTWV